MLQTHTVQTVFRSQLVYMLQKAKAIVLQGAVEDENDFRDEADFNLVSAPFQISQTESILQKDNADSDEEDSEEDPEEPLPNQKGIETMRLKTTNAADDYAHRGPYLKYFFIT